MTTQHYAGFWIRLLAWIVDQVIVAVGLGVLGGVVGIISGVVTALTMPGHHLSQGSSTVLQVASSVLSLILTYLYFILMTKKYQATLGKRLCGLAVVRLDGAALDWNTVLARELVGRLLNGLTLNIGYLIVVFTKRKQGLHDFIAKTAVVRRS